VHVLGKPLDTIDNTWQLLVTEAEVKWRWQSIPVILCLARGCLYEGANMTGAALDLKLNGTLAKLFGSLPEQA